MQPRPDHLEHANMSEVKINSGAERPKDSLPHSVSATWG